MAGWIKRVASWLGADSSPPSILTEGDAVPPSYANAEPQALFFQPSRAMSTSESEEFGLAVLLGDLSQTKALAALGVDFSYTDAFGDSWAHFAYKDAAMLTWLAEAGAPLDQLNHAEVTPLMRAVGKGSDATMRFLAGHPEVNVNRVSANFNTILLEVMRSCHFNDLKDGPEIIRALLWNGADVVYEKETITTYGNLLENAVGDFGKKRIGIQIRQWENRCHAKYLAPGRVFREADFINESGTLTPMAKQLCGTGLLSEAMTLARWEGHEREATRVIHALERQLADFQREHYASVLDPTPFVNAYTPHTEKISVRRQNELPVSHR